LFHKFIIKLTILISATVLLISCSKEEPESFFIGKWSVPGKEATAVIKSGLFTIENGSMKEEHPFTILETGKNEYSENFVQLSFKDEKYTLMLTDKGKGAMSAYKINKDGEILENTMLIRKFD